MQVLAKLLGQLIRPILGGVSSRGCSVKDALLCMSTSAFLLFYLYRQLGEQFMHNQLYHDLQSTIKSLYSLVSKYQQLDDGAPVNFFLSGSDKLEQFFCILRTLYSGSNFDLLQLAERISAAAQILDILLQYPHLDRGERRLGGGSHTLDRVNIRSWVGDLSTSAETICLHEVWIEGLNLAKSILYEHPSYGQPAIEKIDNDVRREIAEGKKVTVLRPYGELIGVNVDEKEEERKEKEKERAAAARRGSLGPEEEPSLVDLTKDDDDDDDEDGTSGGGSRRKEEQRKEDDMAEAYVTKEGEDVEDFPVLDGSINNRSSREVAVSMEDGKKVMMSKPKALKVIAGMRSSDLYSYIKSADRTYRVMDMPKHSGGVKVELMIDEEDDVVRAGDFVICWVKSGKAIIEEGKKLISIRAAVGTITGMWNKRVGGKGHLLEIPESEFSAEETVVMVQLIELQGVEGVEGYWGWKSVVYHREKSLMYKGGCYIALLRPTVYRAEGVGVYQSIKTSHLE